MTTWTKQIISLRTMSWTELVVDKFDYQLYGWDERFAAYREWVDDTATNDPTPNQTFNRNFYDGYILAIRCATGNQYSGCGLRLEGKGGFFLIDNSAAGQDSNTYTYNMTEAQFLKAVGTDYAFSSMTASQDNSANDPQFEIFDCDGSISRIYNCYKFQPKHTSAYTYDPVDEYTDGWPRFDKETTTATAYFYDHTQTGTANAITTTAIAALLGAVQSFTVGATVAVAIATNLAF